MSKSKTATKPSGIDRVRETLHDLELYFKGFQVAVEQKNVEDATRYLKQVQNGINDCSLLLEPAVQEVREKQLQRDRIEKSLVEERSKIQKLEFELAELRHHEAA